ncbi:MAG TPA: hypothetical protein PKC28_00070 [Bdellovibrionales bacterium]|nr:hypothetical protein [Bdellovibrionales bacterium]
MKFLLIAVVFFSGPLLAQEDLLTEPHMADEGRDPAAVRATLNKRTYPGGVDEEDLRVLAALPEAGLKTDARTVQREVYKGLFNQEMKDERHDPVEE